ncbi:hypothetical protein ACLOJK_037952 [Asimina triloba]
MGFCIGNGVGRRWSREMGFCNGHRNAAVFRREGDAGFEVAPLFFCKDVRTPPRQGAAPGLRFQINAAAQVEFIEAKSLIVCVYPMRLFACTSRSGQRSSSISNGISIITAHGQTPSATAQITTSTIPSNFARSEQIQRPWQPISNGSMRHGQRPTSISDSDAVGGSSRNLTQISTSVWSWRHQEIGQ